MRVLSVKQPYAYLLCAGIKDVENRTWKLPEKYKGERVLIHASADQKLNLGVLTREQYSDACNKFKYDSVTLRPIDEWARSAIIGSVRFVDCTVNHPSTWAEQNLNYPELWKTPKMYESAIGVRLVYNWIVKDPILFETPVLGVKGKLNFWNYDINK